MNKRGLSTVITTLIFILLALVVIGILWIVVKNLIEEDSATAEVKAIMLYERVDIVGVYIDPNNPSNLIISIKKLSGKFVLNSSELVSSTVSTPMDVDVVTINDFSRSMKCSNLSSNTCLDSQTKCEDTCGGEWMGPFNSLKSANIQLVNSLINESNTKKIGLIVYSTTTNLTNSLNLTDNAIKLNDTIKGWSNPLGGTCICCGINNASKMLQDLSSPDRKKVMIVMSDGEATNRCQTGAGNEKQDAIAAACTANETLSNLTIYSIGLGDSVDNSTLINISKCGNGSYYKTDISNIASLYENIATQINTMTETYTTIQKISGLRLVVYNNSQSIIINIPGNEVPNVLQTKKYTYNLYNLGLTGEIIRVEVYPLALTSKNKEITGSMLDFWVKK